MQNEWYNDNEELKTAVIKLRTDVRRLDLQLAVMKLHPTVH